MAFQEINIDDVLTCLKTAARLAQTEEDLRVRASFCIEEKILKPLGITQIGRYEYTFISGGRADALYGHVIIEYKAPGKLSTQRDIARAKEQVIRYIMKEAEVEARYKNFLGIIISDRIAFVRYDPITKQWLLRGPYDINRETVIKLIEALRGLRRKKLGVNELLADFGKNPKTGVMSPLAQKAVKVLYNKLINSKKPRVKILFEDWKRLFSQATGYSPSKLKGLEKEYNLGAKNIDYDALLFAIHTYYALIMKLLAAEIAYLYGTGRWLKSYVAELEDAHMRGLEEFRRVLEELESGGVFKRLLGIINFIEGDYFSWYLDELDNELADVIAEIARRLSDYEPATPQLEPEYTRDLLKRLYQHLVPKKIRHDLGEYYTPDWLAELVLDEVGYIEEYFEKLAEEKNDPTAPFKLRLLDPACGSGTFLVIAIRRLRNYAEKHFMLDIMADYVLKNIIGYDLNPLAVLAARTNYLLSIADILPYVKGEKEIPVYLADSILVETRTALYGSFYVLRTTVGTFEIPKQIVNEGLLTEFLNLLEMCLRNLYSSQEFIEMFKSRIASKLKNNMIDYTAIKRLYETFLKSEKEGKNHVWVSIIRNAFAPLLKGQFDYVVGNPPWINWESLPQSYRNISKKLWETYKLTKIYGKTGLGKVKKDLAMLFVTRCLHLYVNDGGKLGFLLPFTVFKTHAGAGFRAFLKRARTSDGKHIPCRVLKVHDLVTLYPFEGAVNRTALIVIEKQGETTFPVDNIIWVNKLGKAIDTDAELEEILRVTKRYKVGLMPIGGPEKPETPWMQISPKAYNAIKKILGKTTYYKAHAGVYTGLNQVYWIQVKDRAPDGLLIITNPPLKSSRAKKVRTLVTKIESDLVYPLARNRNIKKWYIERSSEYIILPVDEDGNPIPSTIMKVKYPNAWMYFMSFFYELVNRKGEPYKSKLEPYRTLNVEDKDFSEKIANIERYTPPFYWLFNVEPALSTYKVAWKRITGAITGKALSFACTVMEPVMDKYLGTKPVIVDEKVMIVSSNNADEAYYLAGVLNSLPVRLAAASYAYELGLATHILDYIYVPRFDPNNRVHKKIAELSRKAHKLAREIYELGKEELKEELRKVEEELDVYVAKLYEITDDELKEIKKMFAILSGEEYVEEEVITEDVKIKPSVQFLHTVVKSGIEDYFEVYIVNPNERNIEIVINAPWSKEKFGTTKREDRIKVRVPSLTPGKYTVKYTIRYDDIREEGEFTIEAKFEGPKRVTRGLADLV